MHGSFNRLRESRNRADRDWTVAVFALPILALIALVALTIMQPAAPGWISQAAQAELRRWPAIRQAVRREQA